MAVQRDALQRCQSISPSKAGIELGENGSIFPAPEGEGALAKQKGRRPKPTQKALPGLRHIPVVNFPFGLILRDAVPLLNLAFELIAATVDQSKVVICELTPLRFDLALHLFQFPSTRFQSIFAPFINRWGDRWLLSQSLPKPFTR
jgi:hypothetical protein